MPRGSCGAFAIAIARVSSGRKPAGTRVTTAPARRRPGADTRSNHLHLQRLQTADLPLQLIALHQRADA